MKTTLKASGKNPNRPIITVQPAKIFKIMWPASMLANSLTDKLIGRKTKDKISTGTMTGIIRAGTPGGKNLPKKPNPLWDMSTPKATIKTTKAKEKVTTMWLVKVKANGIIPNKLPNSINKNMDNIKGK
jgi:hypothetical protein